MSEEIKAESPNETINHLVTQLVQLAKLKDPNELKLLDRLRVANEEIVNLRSVIASKQRELDSLSGIIMQQGAKLDSMRPAHFVYQDGFNAAQKTFAEQKRKFLVLEDYYKQLVKQLRSRLSAPKNKPAKKAKKKKK